LESFSEAKKQAEGRQKGSNAAKAFELLDSKRLAKRPSLSNRRKERSWYCEVLDGFCK
jgi:hypothetical protein